MQAIYSKCNCSKLKEQIKQLELTNNKLHVQLNNAVVREKKTLSHYKDLAGKYNEGVLKFNKQEEIVKELTEDDNYNIKIIKGVRHRIPKI